MDSDFLPSKPKRPTKATDPTENTEAGEELTPVNDTDPTESFDVPDDDGHESLDENPEESSAPAEDSGKPKGKKKRRNPKQ